MGKKDAFTRTPSSFISRTAHPSAAGRHLRSSVLATVPSAILYSCASPSQQVGAGLRWTSEVLVLNCIRRAESQN